jgi:hypothetical protein
VDVLKFVNLLSVATVSLCLTAYYCEMPQIKKLLFVQVSRIQNQLNQIVVLTDGNDEMIT